MKKKSTTSRTGPVRRILGEGGFLAPHVLVAVLLCTGVASSIVTATLSTAASKLALLRREAPAKPSQRTLSFPERVFYQRAIEDVYWRHRIWPRSGGERPDPKPSLDAVMTQAQIEKKVADYLRNSQALEDYWQRPITAEQLQAEMERMARHTKQPGVLHELFAALGNDPFIIAECLARPALAERLLTNWYAYDQKVHGELKQRAEADLQVHNSIEQMKQLSGKYSEIEFVKSDSSDIHPQSDAKRIKLSGSEWEETVRKLAAMFGNGYPVAAGVPPAQPTRLPPQEPALAGTVFSAKDAPIETGKVSSLQEDENRYYAAAVLEKGKNRLTLATVSWVKEPLGSWVAKAQNQVPATMAAVGVSYTLPNLSDGTTCIDDTWTATAGAPAPRASHTAVWTGSKMIVWGGYDGEYTDTGGKYDPGTDSWMATSTTNAPAGRYSHTAVWTGNEMIVWGGTDLFSYFNTGGRYNPGTDSWTATSTTSVPDGRDSHTAVWTGSEMIVWGGIGDSGPLNTGGRYNPGTDSWTATSTTSAPDGRYSHTAVWTGNQMIIWGGIDESFNDSNTGGRYNPSTNSWSATSTTNVPASRDSHTAVWTGNEMIVWGGTDLFNYFNTGGRYNPGTDSWAPTSTTHAPTARAGHTAVWTGNEMIVWGSDGYENTGGRYNPGTDSWTATSITNAPDGRYAHTAVWTGTEMVVWGGYDPNITDTGGRYNPDTDSWLPTFGAPAPRSYHTAAWTGIEMIVWGGTDNGFRGFNTGGRYNASTDSWAAISMRNAPAGRFLHSAVWTGSEMIIWGGFGESATFNTGGRYNPGTDTWTATSTTGVPTGRSIHTAVWSGSEMIVWGGYDENGFPLNTGGRYNPGTNSWTATTTAKAPSARAVHTAVWTGSEMIVWGGQDENSLVFDTGGRYNPTTDTWTATSTTNAPSGRAAHTAVWTGSEMVIWGGVFYDNGYPLNTGGKYNSRTNSWTVTSITNAPDAREGHTAVWTGTEMIVWGGVNFNNGTYFNTGGRYNFATNSWTATSATNAPDGRFAHTAVWTASEMIVWGGDSGGLYVNTGGRYCAPFVGSQLGNISTRGFVQTGDNVVIGGFIVQGTEPKRVIIRAIGPELTQYGVPDALANPTLELHDGTGALIASNNNWATTIIGGIVTTNQVGDIQASGYAPGDPRESAIIADLPPGNYTAIVRGVNNTMGVALMEVYDLSGDASSILGNISSRAFVQTDENVMIGGFIVQGSQPKRVIIRAIGPELGAPPYNVPNALANPTLELHDGTGALIASNNNWATTIIGGIITANQVRDIQAIGYAPSDGLESAIIADLPQGNYTAIVRGVNDTTGVALVEVYDLH